MQVRQTGSITTFCTSSTQGYGITLTLVIFTMPDGSEIELRDTAYNGQPLNVSPCGGQVGPSRGTVFVSADGSAMTFTSDTPINDNTSLNGPVLSAATGNLQMRDGTRYRIVNGTVRSIRDRNGNYLTFAYDSEAPYGKVTQVVDSLGRKVNISYTSPSQAYTDISFTGFNEAIRHIRIGSDSTPGLRSDYQPLTWSQAFPELNGTSQWTGGPGDGNRGYVEIPDGRRYFFYSNSYGELARIELPTGGAYEYDWASGRGPTGSGAITDNNGGGSIYRRVITRRVYDNGGTGNAYTGKMTIDRALGSSVATVKAYDAQNVLLARTDHYYYGDPSYVSSSPTVYPGWGNNREYKTDYFDTNSTTPVRSVAYTWQPRVTYSWAAADPRLVETVTTLIDTNQVSKQTSINPQGGAIGFDQYNNQTDTWEYDFAQVLVRRMHTDYANADHLINGLDYSTAAIHMRSLPTKQQVFDAGGVLRAQISYEYDNYNQSSSDVFHYLLTPRPNISGLDSSFTTNYYKRGNTTATIRNLLDATGGVTASISGYAQYDIAGNVVKVIDPRSTPTNIIATSFDFNDCFGLPDDDARMNSGSIELGSQMSYAFPTKVTNHLGHVTYSQFDYYTGQSVNGEDANGTVASAYYNDLLDRPTQIRRAVGTSLASQTTLSYDDVNRIVTTTSDLNTYEDNALVSKMLYDTLGRTVETRVYESGTNYIATQQQYDALGRVFKTSNRFRPLPPDNQIPTWTTTVFDGLGRVKTVTTPDSAVVSSFYNGQQVLIKDQAGKERMSQTNGLGQLSDVWEITAADDATEAITFPNRTEVTAGYRTKYEYDELGNLITVTQRKGTTGTLQTRSFVYDSLKRLTSATNPESGAVNYQYDNNGNLIQKTDARVPAVTISYLYDALNRNYSRSYSDGTPAVAYIYDADSVPNAKGRMTSVSSSVSSYNYSSYDALGRVRGGTQTTDGQAYTMGYDYDLAGNMTSQTYPSGRVVTSEYDAAARLAGVKNLASGAFYAGGASTDTMNRLQYTPHGSTSQMRLGNGLWEHTNFNLRLQPIQIGLGSAGTNSSLLQLDYTYGTTDNNGNVQSQTITVPTVAGVNGFIATQNYTYDALSRLATAQENGGASWKQNFLYDRFGNRKFVAGTTFPAQLNASNNPVINPNNNRIDTVASGQTIYSYDGVGNLTHDAAGHAFGYDAENKQRTYDGGATTSGGATYYYDGEGQRVKKVLGGPTMVTTVFVYNIAGQLIAEYGGTSGSGGTSYLTSDTLGSPRVITGQNQAVKARHDYLPFGEEPPTGSGGRALAQGYVGDNLRQKFTQKERDNETGLDYFLARYYASTQGRFTSVDPEQAGARNDDPQSWNGYAYARNSPLVYSDPNGRTYTICDSNGKNCVDYTDKEFDKLRKGGPADGYTFSNGKFYYNGEFAGTYSNDCLWCGQLVNEMAARGPAVEKLTVAFAFTAVALGATGGAGAHFLGTGATVTTLGLATRAAPAAAGATGILSQLSRTDATIFQRALDLGASAQKPILENVAYLRDALFQQNVTWKINIIGKIGESPVYGGIPNGAGIAEVNGVTVLVKMVHGNPQILGPLN